MMYQGKYRYRLVSKHGRAVWYAHKLAERFVEVWSADGFSTIVDINDYEVIR